MTFDRRSNLRKVANRHCVIDGLAFGSDHCRNRPAERDLFAVVADDLLLHLESLIGRGNLREARDQIIEKFRIVNDADWLAI